MRLGASLQRTDRWAIDPNRTETTRGEMAGGLGSDCYVVLEEHAGPTARRISSLQEQPFSLADPMPPKVVDLDDAAISNRDDSRGTDGGIERKPVDGAAPPQKV